MNSKNIFNDKKSKIDFEKVKSEYIFKKIFANIKKYIILRILNYNIKLQKRLNISIDDYKESCKLHSSIEIELMLVNNKYDKFINIPNKEKEYYHIYFDNSKEEIKRNYIKEKEKVKLIKIIINHQIKSFYGLFDSCKCISSIMFKRFYRTNITNMSYMFFECSYLKEINLSNFITDNVTDMSGMFMECSSLKELNLSNFNTNNVTNMRYMFYGCSSLKELNLSNFNTKNVTNMKYILDGCSIDLINLIKKKYKDFRFIINKY